MDCGDLQDRAAAPSPCPSCGQAGRPVRAVTLEAILGPARAAPLLGARPRFCRTNSCPLLYYGDAGQRAHKQAARVRVGLKERVDPLPVCYCFGVSRADLERELAETGACTAAARISAQIRAGNCACETKNPSGTCCLGEVHREIQEAITRRRR